MAEPSAGPLDGAWKRLSVTAGDVGPTEVSDVWWLISGGLFADFRVLRDPAGAALPYSSTQSFGGTLSYDAASTTARWHCLFDTEDRDADTDGSLRLDPANHRIMHEDGPDFVEVWVRQDADCEPHGSMKEDGLLAVWAGGYVIAMDAQTGTAGRYLRVADTCLELDAIRDFPLSGAELSKRLIDGT